jgi:very-short-patch-repair endonuclease
MAIEIHVRPVIGGKGDTRVDVAIARLAARQHGVVARAQLVDLGVGGRAIDHRLERGRLHRVHRGVFAVGHTVLSRHGWFMAAVLAAGPNAVLSHRSAAVLWGIRDGSPASVEVTVPRNRRTRRGVTIHRAVLMADEVTTERGIPVTTAARTLLDLAEHLTPQRLERAIHEAEYRRLTSPLSLDALLARHQGRRGTTALKKIVESGGLGAAVTRSEMEADFLAVLDAHRLPRPHTNQHIEGREVDALWPEQRLIVELDGRQAHGTARAFEHDRARDRHLQTEGYRIVRVTYRQLHEQQTTIARQIEALLSPSTTPAASPRRP